MQGDYEQIIRIERIQNPALYLQFIDRKKKMDKVNPKGHQNERSLFHGTTVDTCPKINQNGFNRSYTGRQCNNFQNYINCDYYVIYCLQILHIMEKVYIL
jgi:poly [ADP-ribose] polymerase 10/14/15